MGDYLEFGRNRKKGRLVDILLLTIYVLAFSAVGVGAALLWCWANSSPVSVTQVFLEFGWVFAGSVGLGALLSVPLYWFLFDRD